MTEVPANSIAGPSRPSVETRETITAGLYYLVIEGSPVRWSGLLACRERDQPRRTAATRCESGLSRRPVERQTLIEMIDPQVEQVQHVVSFGHELGFERPPFRQIPCVV